MKSGFTLVEIMVVMVIILIVCAIGGVTTYLDFRHSYEVTAATYRIHSLLRSARDAAISGSMQVEFRVTNDSPQLMELWDCNRDCLYGSAGSLGTFEAQSTVPYSVTVSLSVVNEGQRCRVPTSIVFNPDGMPLINGMPLSLPLTVTVTDGKRVRSITVSCAGNCDLQESLKPKPF